MNDRIQFDLPLERERQYRPFQQPSSMSYPAVRTPADEEFWLYVASVREAVLELNNAYAAVCKNSGSQESKDAYDRAYQHYQKIAIQNQPKIVGLKTFLPERKNGYVVKLKIVSNLMPHPHGSTGEHSSSWIGTFNGPPSPSASI